MWLFHLVIGKFYRFEFEIKDVSELHSHKYLSQPFVCNGVTWTLIGKVKPHPKDVCNAPAYLALFLKCETEDK